MIKGGISHPFFSGNVTNRGVMFKPSILQINQINIIIFHQGYNLANISICFNAGVHCQKCKQSSDRTSTQVSSTNKTTI